MCTKTLSETFEKLKKILFNSKGTELKENTFGFNSDV